MENLTKSLDALIDSLFVEEAPAPADEVAKSMVKDSNPAKETADEAVSQAPKAEKDEARGAGRPKQISDVPQTDEDGSRQGEYDSKIAAKNEETSKKEDSQVAAPSIMKKSLSDEQIAEYETLKKAQEQREAAERLEKARKETNDLIKSAVDAATSDLRKQNEELIAAMREQNELVKSMANRPRQSKAITNIGSVEKFEKSQSSNTFSKAELLDVAEGLVKSKQLEDVHLIELENTGYIYEPEARRVFEAALKRK